MNDVLVLSVAVIVTGIILAIVGLMIATQLKRLADAFIDDDETEATIREVDQILAELRKERDQ